LVAVHDEHRAGGVLSDACADRAEQEPGEPSVAAAADDKHDRARACVEEDLGGAAFQYTELHALWRLITESGMHGVVENLRHVLARVPIGRDGRPSVRGRVLPAAQDLQPGGEDHREVGSPPQRLLRRP